MPNNMLTAMDIFPSAQERQQVQMNALSYQTAKQAKEDQEQLRNSIMSRRPMAPEQVGDTSPSNAENMNAMSGVPSSVPKSASMNEMKWQPQTKAEPQSVFDIKADEFWAQQQQKQASDVIQAAAPELKIAAETGNDSVRAMFAEQMQKKYEQTGNEGFKNVADLYSRLKFEPNGDSIYNGKVEGPMGKKLLETWRMKVKDPAQLAILDSIEDGDDVKVTVNKDKGLTVDHHPTKAKSTVSKDFVTTAGKPVSVISGADGTVSYQDMAGNELGEDQVRRLTADEKSTRSSSMGEAMMKRTYAGPAGTGILRTADGKWFETMPNGERRYVTSQEVEERFAKAGANKKSFENQVKQHDSLESFVTNMKGNIQHVRELMPELTRTGAKFLNVPIKLFLTRIKGDANESNLKMLFAEISTEANKIASGAQSSIAAPSAEMTAKWQAIHDETLPVGELLKVVDMTESLADQRLKSVGGEVKKVGDRITSRNPMTDPLKPKPMDQSEIRAAVIDTAKAMKPGQSRKVTFNGREATIAMKSDGSVSVNFNK